ncbi:hypothetical protein LV779_36665 [Streptomyces thinghirensis]|nr:hypothetical protein [Streptomyces thinghirensis]
MHDERRRIEDRARRLHEQRVRPAIYAATVPLDTEAWQAPWGAVPFEARCRGIPSPFSMGTPWGPPGHDLVPDTRKGSAEWAGEAWRPSSTSVSSAAGPAPGRVRSSISRTAPR